MTEQELKLGEILVKKGWLDADTLAGALKKQTVTREFLGKILLQENKISEERLAMALSEQSKIPFIRAKDFDVEWPFVMRFSSGLISSGKCFPLKAHAEEVVFAIINMLDALTLSRIEAETKGYQLKLALITPTDMEDLLERYRQYVKIQIRKQFNS